MAVDPLVASLMRNLVTQTSPENQLGELSGAIADDTGAMWWDPFDARIQALLALPRGVQLEYNRSQTLGYHSVRVYDTVSLGWLILMCSGELFAHAIPDRQRIALPTRGELMGFATRAEKSRVGSVVIF